jgi:CMP-N-acetylneuraminic acid synthetase
LKDGAVKLLGLIPARGGSKGIPRKNIKLIAGKPLVAWTIEAAQRASVFDAVVVSTDDPEIAEVARRHGADVPFMRPAELARDETPGVEPVLHALQMLPAFDAVLLLQPTSPLRSAADITGCLNLAQQLQAPCVVSVCAPDQHPGWMYRLDDRQRLRPLLDGPAVTRRQDHQPVFAANGALYFARTDWLRQRRTFITDDTAAYVMPAERSVDLDTPLDWKFAEMLLKEGQT